MYLCHQILLRVISDGINTLIHSSDSIRFDAFIDGYVSPQKISKTYYNIDRRLAE